MWYKALATDGDGTLLVDGKMPERTAKALERARAENVFLLLVTGQSSKDLNRFPRIDLFHLVVAENGAVLFNPSNGMEVVIGHAPPEQLVQALHDAGVRDLEVGRSIISARIKDEEILRREVERLRLDWHVVRNRHRAMVLPRGIDKASGLSAALGELNIRPEQVVAVGDGENDGVLLAKCGLGIAVADAIADLKKRADATTQRGAGYGIVELIDNILAAKPHTRNAGFVI
jgi:HAD superfamily hydrolase (TIGR01484 family)